MNFRRTGTALCVVSILAGCATAPKDITASYISPMQYQGYDCNQLAAESQRIQARVSQVGGRLDEAATNDKLITAAGALIFWPALFFIGGTKQQETEYARLKGEYDAVAQQSIARKCDGAVPASVTNLDFIPTARATRKSELATN